jgi:hypothetical protein
MAFPIRVAAASATSGGTSTTGAREMRRGSIACEDAIRQRPQHLPQTLSRGYPAGREQALSAGPEKARQGYSRTDNAEFADSGT